MGIMNLLPIVGDIAGGVSSYYGGQSAKNAIREGRTAANAQDQKGVDQYGSTMADAQTRANPYMSAGAGAVQSQQDLLQNGLPKQSGAFNFDAFSDPSTRYSISESNRALQAAGLAGGNAGGALAKALQGNANSLAQGAYQNAYQRYLQQNQQDFGQQQTNFQNQLGGWQNMAGMGANMVQGLNSNQMQGASGMANLYNSMGNRYMDAGKEIAGLNAGQASAFGGAAQSGIKDFGASAQSGGLGSFLQGLF